MPEVTEEQRKAASTETPPPPAPAGQKKAGEDEEPDGSNWSDDVKSYVSKLRNENASWRKKVREFEAKTTTLETKLGSFESGLKKLVGGEEDDKTSPEEKLTILEQTRQGLELENAILASAVENGIPADQFEYYSFLLNNRFAKLEENEELSEEMLEEVISKVKGNVSAGAKNTSVEGSNTPNPESTPGTVTLEQFKNMSMTEKSVLFQKNKDLYNSLFSQAKAKRLLL